MGEAAADLLLVNGRILTMDAARPRARCMAVAGGVLVAVGGREVERAYRDRSAAVLDAEGDLVLPGFIDAHLHLFALAASLVAVDCRRGALESIDQMQRALADRARITPPGRWVVGSGYDEFWLAEKRHPGRDDLDVASKEHPLQVRHRSGHASILNSHALALLGLDQESPDPEGGLLEREAGTGRLTGVAYDLDDWISRRSGPRRSPVEQERGVALAWWELLSQGNTSIHDATPTNGLARWEELARRAAAGRLPVRVLLMVGLDALSDFPAAGLTYRSGDARLRLGPAKILLLETRGRLSPSEAELRAMLAEARSLGFPVAVHAVEPEPIGAAARAMAAVPSPAGTRHRIEHCSRPPPLVLGDVARSGAAVVTQPGFLAESGARYRAELGEAALRWLYPIRALRRRGVLVAGSSDAPVSRASPLQGIAAALDRGAGGGAAVAPQEAVGERAALSLFTTAAAEVGGASGVV
ncbi:MAG: amidohydrolase family protein, partial [Chloroflexi bacterium]|nr:amidohydrolase family protein [Chloroflexota bacterium]